MQPIYGASSPPATTLGYALSAPRWLQAPLHFGLVAAQGVYVYKFFNELWALIPRCVTGQATETYVMLLAVLSLVDVVMIANLLIMVIVGGCETFVSRIGLQGHRDQPERLSHANSNVRSFAARPPRHWWTGWPTTPRSYGSTGTATGSGEPPRRGRTWAADRRPPTASPSVSGTR